MTLKLTLRALSTIRSSWEGPIDHPVGGDTLSTLSLAIGTIAVRLRLGARQAALWAA